MVQTYSSGVEPACIPMRIWQVSNEARPYDIKRANGRDEEH